MQKSAVSPSDISMSEITYLLFVSTVSATRWFASRTTLSFNPPTQNGTKSAFDSVKSASTTQHTLLVCYLMCNKLSRCITIITIIIFFHSLNHIFHSASQKVWHWVVKIYKNSKTCNQYSVLTIPWRNEIHDLMNIHEQFMNIHELFMNGNHIWFMN